MPRAELLRYVDVNDYIDPPSAEYTLILFCTVCSVIPMSNFNDVNLKVVLYYPFASANLAAATDAAWWEAALLPGNVE